MTQKELREHKGLVWWNSEEPRPGQVGGFSPRSGQFLCMRAGKAKIDSGISWYEKPSRLYPSEDALAKAYCQHLKAKLRNLSKAKRKYLADITRRRCAIKLELAAASFHLNWSRLIANERRTRTI